jgi:hypothetical protein
VNRPRLAAAVVPTASAATRLTPLDARGVRITGGFWGERLRQNREWTLPHGASQLERSGNLANLHAAAAGRGSYRGGHDDFAWGNREPAGMRVWIPVDDATGMSDHMTDPRPPAGAFSAKSE